MSKALRNIRESIRPKPARELLRRSGLRIKDVAIFAHVSRRTIYQWLEAYDEENFERVRTGMRVLLNYLVDNPRAPKQEAVAAMVAAFGNDERRTLYDNSLQIHHPSDVEQGARSIAFDSDRDWMLAMIENFRGLLDTMAAYLRGECAGVARGGKSCRR